jgi:hypothetical protein
MSHKLDLLIIKILRFSDMDSKTQKAVVIDEYGKKPAIK